MLLSRFWYLILSFALAAAAGILFVAQSFYNRSTERWLNEALAADISAVGWYVKDDARNRAAALLPVSLAPDLRVALAKSSEADEVPKESREKAKRALAKAADDVPADLKFTAIWAVDADGRVVADHQWPHKDAWNLGGHAIVADALAGWIRDDTWVIKEKLFRVVARPVERDGGGEPIGAVIGVVAVDAAYAAAVQQRTGAAVAFFALGTRSASSAPDGFNAANFDVLQSDLKEAELTEEYQQIGRSKVRRPRTELGFIYARMPGEAWDLQSGYVVGRSVTLFDSPLGFFQSAEQSDTDGAPRGILIGIGLGLGLLGILFSVLEHTIPLRTFKNEAMRFAEGKTDTLAPSRFRGLFKKIAADVNDGVDKALSKGGVTRRAADLESVIGPLPAKPTMSAFAVPDAPTSAPQSADRPLPTAKRVPAPPPKPSAGRAAPPPPAASTRGEELEADAPMSGAAPSDEMGEWKKVFEDFLKTKKQCGEPTDSLTFDKFKGTLERNKAALVARHNCSAVKFTVYVKDGKAALRASPFK